MAQHDYEEQPEAPDLCAAVQLDTSDTLAGPAGDIDGLDAGYSPPDRPYVLDDDEVTASGQLEGDTLDERIAREEPEELPVDLDRAGRLTDEGQGAALERSDATAAEDVGIDGPDADAARVDAARDMRATDEGSDRLPEDPETGPVDEDEALVDRGADRTGSGPDPAYPHGSEPDPARSRYPDEQP